MSQVIQKATRGTVYQSIAQLLLALGGFVVAAILTRALTPADYGVYVQIYSALMAAEQIVLWGVHSAVSRLTAETGDSDGRVRATGMTVALVSCCASFAILWLAAPWVSVWLGIGARVDLLRLAIIDIPCFGSYFLIAHVLNGRRDFIGQSIGIYLYAIAKIVGTASLLAIGLSIRGALIINILASLAGLVWVLARAGFPGLAWHREAVSALLRLAAAMGTIVMATQLMLGMDQWLIGTFNQGIGEDVGGYYSAAKTLARLPNLVTFILNAVLIPTIALAVARGENDLVRRLVQGSFRFLLLTLFPACVLIAVTAGPLLKLIYGSNYDAGAEYLRFLVIGNGLLQTLCSTLITVLVATRHQRTAAVVAVVALLPAVILNAVLIPRLGPVGGALAAALAAAVAVVLAGVTVVRHMGRFVAVGELARVTPAVALVGVLASWLPANPFLLLPGLVALAVLFFAACWLLGALKVSDISDVFGQFKSKQVTAAVAKEVPR